MYHGNDRLINLAVGAVVVIVFLLIGRLKRSLGKPPSETYRCGRCRRTFLHDTRTVKAWRNGYRKFFCPECHTSWRNRRDAEQFARDQEYAGRGGCLGVLLLCAMVVVLMSWLPKRAKLDPKQESAVDFDTLRQIECKTDA